MIRPDINQLGAMPPFCRLDLRQLREILALSDSRHLTGGATVFDEGQPVRRFHLLMSGNIRLVRVTAEGDQIILLHIQAGQVFGIGAALGQETYHASAIAAGDCRVLSWPNALWPGFSSAYDGFAVETFRAFGARADEMSNRIVELSTQLVEQRIACALLRMIGQSGRKVAGGIEIGFPITRQNIADMTGTTLHTVSRVLSLWERDGVVKSTRCLVIVTDPHRLVVMSGAGLGTDADDPIIQAKAQALYATAAASAARKASSSSAYSAQASITV
ncbi:Crp/Fnr family transcriptional regulator [Frigidibacter sp.]|uniref:Crp/Fnr family transcriptional regulator n=1 Tax=Frigidibacter sp. TaxID=2586418 RepID=UPI00352470E0